MEDGDAVVETAVGVGDVGVTLEGIKDDVEGVGVDEDDKEDDGEGVAVDEGRGVAVEGRGVAIEEVGVTVGEAIGGDDEGGYKPPQVHAPSVPRGMLGP